MIIRTIKHAMDLAEESRISERRFISTQGHLSKSYTIIAV